MYQVNEVAKTYTRGTPHRVLKDVSFSLKKGEIVGIVGANGAGKSTLMKIMCALRSEDFGNIGFENLSSKENRISYLKQIGAFIEAPAFFMNMSGERNLKLFSEFYDVSDKDIDAIIDQLGMRSYIKKRVSTYSAGMKQLLAIAIASVHRPKLLILDEPINGIDPHGVMAVHDLLHTLASEGTAILVSSHIMADLIQVCDRILILDNGSIRTEVDVKQLTSGRDLSGVILRGELSQERLIACATLVDPKKIVALNISRNSHLVYVFDPGDEEQTALRELAIFEPITVTPLEDIFVSVVKKKDE